MMEFARNLFSLKSECCQNAVKNKNPEFIGALGIIEQVMARL
jgi:hypothetical protein